MRVRDQGGVALVELAFVALLVFTLAAGAFDYGFAWRSGLAANEAARSGARVGSGQGATAGADYYALNSVRASLVASGQMGKLRRVVIFQAASADGRVPASCLEASPIGPCNVLSPQQLLALDRTSFDLAISTDPDTAPTGTGCLEPSAATLANWCPDVRVNDPQDAADFIGVFVELFYENQFLMLGEGTTVRRTAVMRLEPK